MSRPDVALVTPYPADGSPQASRSGVATYAARLAGALAERGAGVEVLAPAEEGARAHATTGASTSAGPYARGPARAAGAAAAARHRPALVVYLRTRPSCTAAASSIPTLVLRLGAARGQGSVTMHHVVDPPPWSPDSTRASRPRRPGRPDRPGRGQRAIGRGADRVLVHEPGFAGPGPGRRRRAPWRAAGRADRPGAARERRGSTPDDRLVVLCWASSRRTRASRPHSRPRRCVRDRALVVAGGEHPRLAESGDRYARDLRSRHAGDDATFTGYVDEARVGDWFAAADIALLPYPAPTPRAGRCRWRSGPARRCPLRPLARCAGAPDACAVAAAPDALADRLRSLAGDPAARAALARASSELARDRAWPAVADRHLAVYEEVTHGRGGPRRRLRAANPGDEALLSAFVGSLPEQDVVATSVDPLHTETVHGVPAVQSRDVRAVARRVMRADGVVLADGTIFKTLHPASGRPPIGRALGAGPDARYVAQRAPLAAVGVGVGSLHVDRARALARGVVRRCDLLVLRDEESADLLARADAPAPFRVGADPAWTLVDPPGAPSAQGDAVIVALSHLAGGPGLAPPRARARPARARRAARSAPALAGPRERPGRPRPRYRRRGAPRRRRGDRPPPQEPGRRARPVRRGATRGRAAVPRARGGRGRRCAGRLRRPRGQADRARPAAPASRWSRPPGRPRRWAPRSCAPSTTRRPRRRRSTARSASPEIRWRCCASCSRAAARTRRRGWVGSSWLRRSGSRRRHRPARRRREARPHGRERDRNPHRAPAAPASAARPRRRADRRGRRPARRRRRQPRLLAGRRAAARAGGVRRSGRVPGALSRDPCADREPERRQRPAARARRPPARRRVLRGGLAAGATLAAAALPLGALLNLPPVLLLALAAAAPASGLLALERGRLYRLGRTRRAAASLLAEPVVRLGAGSRSPPRPGLRAPPRGSYSPVGGARVARARAGRPPTDGTARRPTVPEATAATTVLAFLGLAVVQNQDVLAANALLDSAEAGVSPCSSTLGGVAAFATTTVPLMLLPRAAAGERSALPPPSQSPRTRRRRGRPWSPSIRPRWSRPCSAPGTWTSRRSPARTSSRWPSRRRPGADRARLRDRRRAGSARRARGDRAARGAPARARGQRGGHRACDPAGDRRADRGRGRRNGRPAPGLSERARLALGPRPGRVALGSPRWSSAASCCGCSRRAACGSTRRRACSRRSCRSATCSRELRTTDVHPPLHHALLWVPCACSGRANWRSACRRSVDGRADPGPPRWPAIKTAGPASRRPRRRRRPVHRLVLGRGAHVLAVHALRTGRGAGCRCACCAAGACATVLWAPAAVALVWTRTSPLVRGRAAAGLPRGAVGRRGGGRSVRRLKPLFRGPACRPYSGPPSRSSGPSRSTSSTRTSPPVMAAGNPPLAGRRARSQTEGAAQPSALRRDHQRPLGGVGLPLRPHHAPPSGAVAVMILGALMLLGRGRSRVTSCSCVRCAVSRCSPSAGQAVPVRGALLPPSPAASLLGGVVTGWAPRLGRPWRPRFGVPAALALGSAADQQLNSTNLPVRLRGALEEVSSGRARATWSSTRRRTSTAVSYYGDGLRPARRRSTAGLPQSEGRASSCSPASSTSLSSPARPASGLGARRGPPGVRLPTFAEGVGVPDERRPDRSARRAPPAPARHRARLRLLLLLAVPLALWYFAWLLDPERIGHPALCGALIAAEVFNLVQGLGFWWTCSRERVRERAPAADGASVVDVFIPVYNEPVDVVEPALVAATQAAWRRRARASAR